MFGITWIKLGVYGVIIASMVGSTWYFLDHWHYKHLRDKANLETQLTTVGTSLNTCLAQKEKLIVDMSTVYDDGYYTGIGEGYERKKSNIATIHSVKFPF